MSNDPAQVPLWEALYEMKDEAAITSQMALIWPFIDAKSAGSVDVEEIFKHFIAKDEEMAVAHGATMPEDQRAAAIAEYGQHSIAENALLKEHLEKNAEGRADLACFTKLFIWRLCVKGM